MTWRVTVDPVLPIIETHYSGSMTKAEVCDAAARTLELAWEHGRRLLLGDCSTLQGGHSLADLYFLADFVLSCEFSHSLKEAVILPGLQVASEHVRFWETTCLNRGINVRIFNDRPGALAWLLEQVPL